MKIAFLAPRYHTNQISLVKYFLKKKNHVSFYVTRVSKSEDHSSLKPSIIELSFISKVIKHFSKSNNLLFDYNYLIPSINELLKFKSKKFDVIIIREPNKLMGLVYFLWSKLIRVKIITYYQREIYKKNSFKIKDIIEKIFIKASNDQYISPCLGDHKYKKFNSKNSYLPFCLSTKSPKKKWCLNNKVNILTIGKFISRKKHLLLIRTLSMIKSKNNFQLTIVGECSNKEQLIYLKKVKQEIKIRRLKYNILINLRPSEVNKLYKKNDLFVLPSVNEPASVSNLEAMSNGLAVITTDSNQTSCYTEHGLNGYVVKSNDLQDLKKKLTLLIDDRTKLKKFGYKSFNIVRKKYNPNIVYEKFYKKLLNFKNSLS